MLELRDRGYGAHQDDERTSNGGKRADFIPSHGKVFFEMQLFAWGAASDSAFNGPLAPEKFLGVYDVLSAVSNRVSAGERGAPS